MIQYEQYTFRKLDQIITSSTLFIEINRVNTLYVNVDTWIKLKIKNERS